MRRVLPCLALVTACAADPCRDAPATGACFAQGPATPISLGFHPAAARSIDLDGDGHLDLVTAHGTYQSFGAAWGPDYAIQTTWSIGQELADLAIADVDHDGHLDLAAALPADDAVVVAFGAADRTRADVRRYATGASPRALRSADLDADGDADLVTADLGDGTLTVALFTGRDAATTRHRVGDGPTALAVADLDRDGQPDVAVTLADSDELALLRGTGGGDLGKPSTWPTGQLPLAVAALPDGSLAVAGALSDDVSIHAPDGPLQRTWPVAPGPHTLTAIDLGDGPQLAVLSDATAAILDPITGTLAPVALRGATDVLLPAADGLTYLTRDATRVDLRRADGPHLAERWKHVQDIILFAAAAADLDGDGRPDLAVRPADTRVDIRLADADGLGPIRSFAMQPGYDVQQILPIDLDGDGVAALLLIDPGAPTRALVLAPDGAGDFLPFADPIALAADKPTLFIADLDGDARDDLLVLGDGDPRLHRGAGTTLDPPVTLPAFTGRPLTVADIDGDSVPDLLLAQSSPAPQLDVLLDPLGAATLVSTPLAASIAGTGLRDAAAADLDADGHTDVILCRDGGLERARGRGDGTFTLDSFAPPRLCGQVRLHDLDDDGDRDLLALARDALALDVWLADGATFSLLTRQSIPEEAAFLTAAGPPALLAHDYIRARLLVPEWSTILAEVDDATPIPKPPFQTRFGDLDGDGALDLVGLSDHHLFLARVADPAVTSHDLGDVTAERFALVDDAVVVALTDSQDRATLTRYALDDLAPTVLTELDEPPETLLAGDLDGDARPDLVIATSTPEALQVTALRAAADLTRDPPQLLPPARAVALADLDGDRRLDLWLLTADATLAVARRGADSFADPYPWGGPTDPDSVRLEDLTGDGVLDLLSVSGASIVLTTGARDGRAAGPPRRVAPASELEALGIARLPGDPRPAIVVARDGDPASVPLTIGRPTDYGYAFQARRIPRLDRTNQILQPRPGDDLIVTGPAGYTVVEAVP